MIDLHDYSPSNPPLIFHQTQFEYGLTIAPELSLHLLERGDPSVQLGEEFIDFSNDSVLFRERRYGNFEG